MVLPACEALTDDDRLFYALRLPVRQEDSLPEGSGQKLFRSLLRELSGCSWCVLLCSRFDFHRGRMINTSTLQS